MARKIKKEIVQLDDTWGCPIVAYGYTDKREARADIAKFCEIPVKDIRLADLAVRRVRAFEGADGDMRYDWSKCCSQCGRKSPEGIDSFIYDC